MYNPKMITLTQLLTVVSVKVVLVTDSVTSLFPEEPRGSSAGTLLLPRKLDIMMRTMLKKNSTGSSRKSVKSKSRSRGVYFHKKSIFAAVPSRKIATNYSSTASRSFKILFRLPSKVVPPTCLQALARCLRCLADFTTSSWSKLSAKLSTTLFSSVKVTVD